MTITTPAGNKVRCTSNRRFWVIEDIETRDGQPRQATTLLRTDNSATARMKVRRKGGGALFTEKHKTTFVIFDSFRQEFIR